MNNTETSNLIALGEGFTTEFKQSGSTNPAQRERIGNEAREPRTHDKE